MYNKTTHKHAAVIKEWADGAVIQHKVRTGEWRDVYNNEPTWRDWEEYRVKPEPKPDIIKQVSIHIVELRPCLMPSYDYEDNIKLTFDGETGKLKEAEVIA